MRAFRLAVGIAIVREAGGELFLHLVVGPRDLRLIDQVVAEEEVALDFRIAFGEAVQRMAALPVRPSGDVPPPRDAALASNDMAQSLQRSISPFQCRDRGDDAEEIQARLRLDSRDGSASDVVEVDEDRTQGIPDSVRLLSG
jgi:hypothetical protein